MKGYSYKIIGKVSENYIIKMVLFMKAFSRKIINMERGFYISKTKKYVKGHGNMDS